MYLIDIVSKTNIISATGFLVLIWLVKYWTRITTEERTK